MPFYDTQKIEVLLDPPTLNRRIQELATQITHDYTGKGDVVLIGVLKGCFLFFADLVRHIDLPISTDFLGLSSYGSSFETSGIVRVTQDLSQPVKDKHVLVVEDIVDTGLTMNYLLANLETRKPKSVRVVTLLHKPARAQVKVPLDYVGFEIPDRFVVGYGLDFKGKLRNLPFIGVNLSDGIPFGDNT